MQKEPQNLIDYTKATLQRKKVASSNTAHNDGAPLAWVEEIFKRFHAIFGGKWLSLFPDDDEFVQTMKSEWSMGLANFNGDQIKKGLDECRLNCVWPPSLAEFGKLCLGENDKYKDIPDEFTAYNLATKKDWKHITIYAAVQMIGTYAFTRQLSERDALDKFKWAYRACVKRFKAGEDLGCPIIDNKRLIKDDRSPDGYIDPRIKAREDAIRKAPEEFLLNSQMDPRVRKILIKNCAKAA